MAAIKPTANRLITRTQGVAYDSAKDNASDFNEDGIALNDHAILIDAAAAAAAAAQAAADAAQATANAAQTPLTFSQGLTESLGAVKLGGSITESLFLSGSGIDALLNENWSVTNTGQIFSSTFQRSYSGLQFSGEYYPDEFDFLNSRWAEFTVNGKDGITLRRYLQDSLGATQEASEMFFDNLGNIIFKNVGGTGTFKGIKYDANNATKWGTINSTNYFIPHIGWIVDYAEPKKAASDYYVTSAEKTILSNTSGTNTGDQDLSGKQDNITLTTLGTSGAATFVGNVLNIPSYSVTGGLTASDIDTLAKINAIITDATLIDTLDSRLSDARTPLTHAASHVNGTDDIQSATNAQKGLATATHIQAIEANTAKVGITTQQAADIVANNAKISFDSTSSTRLANTSGTNTGDNAINSLYSGLVTNATHTGEVTGSGALTVDKTAISNKTGVTALGSDYVLIGDSSDTNNLKKALISSFVKESIKIPIGAIGTDHTVATNVIGMHIDYGFYLESVTLEFNPIATGAAPTGANFVVDINVGNTDGTSMATILSTKLSVDAGEFHSSTATTAAVISSPTIAQYKFISIDVDQIGSTLAGQGGFVTLNGYRT